MLKTNSKQARTNIHNYIMSNFDGCNYDIETPDNFHDTALIIYHTFINEKYHLQEDYKYYHNNECAAFTDWCAGLPSILDTCYYYNRSAVDDLGEILEETAAEKSKYDETAAEKMLSYLIYREITRVIK